MGQGYYPMNPCSAPGHSARQIFSDDRFYSRVGGEVLLELIKTRKIKEIKVHCEEIGYHFLCFLMSLLNLKHNW